MYKKAARLVAARGYTNVMTCKEGIPGWVKAGYTVSRSTAMEKVDIPTCSPEELNDVLGSVVVLDIRVPSLYEMGWIKDSVKVPLGRLSTKYGSLSKDAPIVIVDHAGKQVLAAARFLKTHGCSDVRRLQGGLLAWGRKGYPLEK